MFASIIKKLTKGQNLNQAELAFFVNADLSVAEQKEILLKLETKGPAPAEVAGLIKLLRGAASLAIICPGAVDICGTGGSGVPRLNTSTLAAFVLAALGVPIAKHGNKAASGRFGSFDLLEGLGINIEPSLERMSFVFYKEGLLFMFARQFYPVMKKFAASRAELVQPSVFNILGPLLSPANPAIQLIGAADRSKMELMAKAAALLGRTKVLVVRGEDGLDEVTLAGRTEIVELERGKIKRYYISPADFGLKAVASEKIMAGTPEKNISLAKAVLQDQASGPIRDLVLINAAVVLKMAGKVKTYRQGYVLAKKSLQSGSAYKKFVAYKELISSQSVLEEIAGHKYQEVAATKFNVAARVKKSDRNFLAALQKPALSLIAEIKRGSPSKGDLQGAKPFNSGAIAKLYEANGASAISVLTDRRYFQGDNRYLTQARRAVKLPVLRKDFIIDRRQIKEARQLGADAILLIVAILSDNQLKDYLAEARKFGMQALVEAHNQAELERAIRAGAKIVGINNRDLHTLKTDLNVTRNLLPHIPSDVAVVSESGIANIMDAKSLPQRVNAILVGTSIMSSSGRAEMADKVKELATARKIFKACGLRTMVAARFCEKIGVAMAGLNFVPASKRCISLSLAKQIRKELKNTKAVGIFRNQPLSYIHKVARALNLDYVQLAGEESLSYTQGCNYPVIKTIVLRRRADITLAQKYLAEKNMAFIIFDSLKPGSGQKADYNLLAGVKFPYLIAGGIKAGNIKSLSKIINPMGFDSASGLEDNNGQVSVKNIKALAAAINKL